MTNHETNYDTYRLSNVIIRYYKGELDENTQKPKSKVQVKDKGFDQDKEDTKKKKRCLLFDYGKKKQHPTINVVKIFGRGDDEEDVFEFEVDKEGNYEENKQKNRITFRRQVNAFDKYYIVEIECTKGEKLY